MSQIKILLVEDEEGIIDFFVTYLNMKGFNNILTAAAGKEAIEKIENEKPDFVFPDISLADNVSGMEVLKQARVLSPKTKCIMMSAYKDEYGQEAEKLGAIYFLKKPITNLGQMIKLMQDFQDK